MPDKYEKPSVTVDMLVFTVDEQALKLLLIKRKNDPFKACWAIPGGFVNIDESLDDAAARELREETGLNNIYMEQLYTWGAVNRDPRSRVISTSYIALTSKEGLRPIAGDDAQEAKWFIIKKTKIEDISEETSDWRLELESEDGQVNISYTMTENIIKNGVEPTIVTNAVLNDSSNSSLSFDHASIVYMALERLANKVEYTAIAFNLVPDEFTLSQLQKVYEIILQRPLFKANFRKKVKKMVVDTDKFLKDVRHRPSRLYRFNPTYKGDI